MNMHVIILWHSCEFFYNYDCFITLKYQHNRYSSDYDLPSISLQRGFITSDRITYSQSNLAWTSNSCTYTHDQIRVESYPNPNIYDILEPGTIPRCHIKCCVTTYNEKALKPVQTSLLGFSEMCRYTRFGMVSKYVSVYKMGDWVVRCFFTNRVFAPLIDVLIDKTTIAPPPDIHERYRAISDYINQHIQQLPFLVPQIWIEKGISINRQDWPFIKATFIRAATLGMFLEDMHREPTVVAMLAEQWLAMINTLEALNMAHGDLNLTNVLVYGTYPHVVLRLVDFDSMYVPMLNGRALYELGDENFQPIHPGVRRFNSEMDRFSALVIYLSLIALVEDALLWEQCKADEDAKLLLGANDFRDLKNSPAYNLLRAKHTNQQLQQCLDELARSIREQRMPRSLSNVLQAKQDIG
jgi:hypothetical protein